MDLLILAPELNRFIHPFPAQLDNHRLHPPERGPFPHGRDRQGVCVLWTGCLPQRGSLKLAEPSMSSLFLLPNQPRGGRVRGQECSSSMEKHEEWAYLFPASSRGRSGWRSLQGSCPRLTVPPLHASSCSLLPGGRRRAGAVEGPGGGAVE